MSDRARAIEVLTAARDELARRLVERVVDAAPELLDEARGDSYGGEIDAIHDQLAARLASVNAMLSQILSLPEIPGPPADDPHVEVHRVTTAGVTFEAPLSLTNVFAETTLPAASAEPPPAIEPGELPMSPGLTAGIHQQRSRAMDKKAKKRIDLLNAKLQTLRQQLSGARRQMDDPDEVKRLEHDIAAAEAEIARLKAE